MAFVKASGTDPKRVLAHFDEWTTAMGLLTLRADMPEAATVFTTHATSIGRSICGNGKPLYDYLEAYNGDQMAAELNTYAIQAGRELRVIVGADKLTDQESESLSHDIAKKIQDEMTYPGQVKITVIRETRAVSYAK